MAILDDDIPFLIVVNRTKGSVLELHRLESSNLIQNQRVVLRSMGDIPFLRASLLDQDPLFDVEIGRAHV